MANAAAGVSDIARAARNDVNMEVLHGLAPSRALIEPNIEPVRRIPLDQQLPAPLDGAGQSVLFGRVELGPGRRMSMGGEQQMPFRNRKGVPNRLHQRLDERDALALWEAKRAVEIRQARAPAMDLLTGKRPPPY